MAGVTLDTGALIAAGRDDRVFWTWWKLMTRRGMVATLPAPVVAQAWRGARDARMAQVILGCRCIALDLDLARRAGVLCAKSGTADIVDAAVAVIAAERGEDVLTSDPDDITHLAEHHKRIGRVVSLAHLCEHDPR